MCRFAWNDSVSRISFIKIPTRKFEPHEALEISVIAHKVRESLIEAREPLFLENYMSVASTLMLSAANSEKQFFFGRNPGTMSVNSILASVQNSLPLINGCLL